MESEKFNDNVEKALYDGYLESLGISNVAQELCLSNFPLLVDCIIILYKIFFILIIIFSQSMKHD